MSFKACPVLEYSQSLHRFQRCSNRKDCDNDTQIQLIVTIPHEVVEELSKKYLGILSCGVRATCTPGKRERLEAERPRMSPRPGLAIRYEVRDAGGKDVPMVPRDSTPDAVLEE